MPGPFQVAFDCADVEVMVHFWEIALAEAHYRMPDPPEGFADWYDFAAKQNIPKEDWIGSLIDPTQVYPTLYFQRVPEGKTAKNRLHLDLPVSDPQASPEENRQRINRKAEQLTAAGASVLYMMDEGHGFWITMADPEGNEFCLI